VDHSSEIAAAGEAARETLELKHEAREITLLASRRAIRSCSTAIRAVHRGEFREARELIAVAAAYLAEADTALDGHPDVRYAGFIHDAKKEFAEANLTLAFVAGNPIPTADELGVEVQAYLNGMSEAASELRRQTLDCLRRDDNEEAERLLAGLNEPQRQAVVHGEGPLLVLAGREYGSGSSRDWAAKGPLLLGVRAVVAESFERIHRTNLIGMGILPLEFPAGETAESLGLTGRESYSIRGLEAGLAPHAVLRVEALEDDGPLRTFDARCRLDGPVEVDYYRHGGILPAVLRRLAAEGRSR